MLYNCGHRQGALFENLQSHTFYGIDQGHTLGLNYTFHQLAVDFELAQMRDIPNCAGKKLDIHKYYQASLAYSGEIPEHLTQCRVVVAPRICDTGYIISFADFTGLNMKETSYPVKNGKYCDHLFNTDSTRLDWRCFAFEGFPWYYVNKINDNYTLLMHQTVDFETLRKNYSKQPNGDWIFGKKCALSRNGHNFLSGTRLIQMLCVIIVKLEILKINIA